MQTLDIQQPIQSPTKLHTLSGLRLEHTNFTRPKPLLLLAYLCIEGRKEKRFLAELFWPGASNHLNSLAKALSQLRSVGVVDNDDTHAWATVKSDVNEFLEALEERDFGTVITLYQDSFLSGFYLPDWGTELEEWIYTTKEFLAAQMRAVWLDLAEASRDPQEITRYAERAYEQEVTLEPEIIVRLYKLLSTTPHAAKLKQEAKEFGISLEAQAKTITSNLPTRGTSFIGRDIERLELGELLSQKDVRLLTIMGPGGVGKTRLALEVARELQDSFPDGIVFFPVENLVTPEQMLAGLAAALSVQLTEEDCAEQLPRIIADKKVLLLMDSLEYQVESAYKGSAFLARCPNLKILVTSRVRLNLEEEWLYALEGFSLPSDLELEQAELNDAVALFVQRAKKVRQSFVLTQESLPLVLEICRRVEGLPLGIELAASWVKTMSCEAILAQLDDLDFLTTPLANVPERQQSLRSVFEGSWKLLSKEEQSVLSKLSVFRGGFMVEAAREVAGATLMMLARLVDKSLLRVSATSRYDFHPLLQHYLREKLFAMREEEETTTAHAHYFLALAERAKVYLRSASAGEWLKRLDSEFANINTALTTLRSPETAPLAMRFVSILSQFWQSQNYLSEGRKLAREILRLDATRSPERAHLLLVAGNLAWIQGDYHEAKTFYEESLSAWQTFGDKAREATVLNNIGLIARNRGDYAHAKGAIEAYLEICRSLGDTRGIARAHYNLGTVYSDLAELDKAQGLFQESLRIARELDDKQLIGTSLFNFADIAYERQDYHSAIHYATESLAWQREVAYKIGEALTLNLLGKAACALGDYKEARAYLRESLELRKNLNGKPGLISSLEAFGDLALAEGKSDKAVALWAAATGIREMINLPVPPYLKERRENNFTKAREQLGEAAFTTAWAKGSLMGDQQAITLALEETSKSS